jgi:hypothetical protein
MVGGGWSSGTMSNTEPQPVHAGSRVVYGDRWLTNRTACQACDRSNPVLKSDAVYCVQAQSRQVARISMGHGAQLARDPRPHHMTSTAAKPRPERISYHCLVINDRLMLVVA